MLLLAFLLTRSSVSWPQSAQPAQTSLGFTQTICTANRALAVCCHMTASRTMALTCTLRDNAQSLRRHQQAISISCLEDTCIVDGCVQTAAISRRTCHPTNHLKLGTAEAQSLHGGLAHIRLPVGSEVAARRYADATAGGNSWQLCVPVGCVPCNRADVSCVAARAGSRVGVQSAAQRVVRGRAAEVLANSNKTPATAVGCHVAGAASALSS